MVNGDDSAITAQELAGYELFKNSGCVACHNGSALGGNSFQKMGLIEPYQTNNKVEGLSAVNPTLTPIALNLKSRHCAMWR